MFLAYPRGRFLYVTITIPFGVSGGSMRASRCRYCKACARVRGTDTASLAREAREVWEAWEVWDAMEAWGDLLFTTPCDGAGKSMSGFIAARDNWKDEDDLRG